MPRTPEAPTLPRPQPAPFPQPVGTILYERTVGESGDPDAIIPIPEESAVMIIRLNDEGLGYVSLHQVGYDPGSPWVRIYDYTELSGLYRRFPEAVMAGMRAAVAEMDKVWARLDQWRLWLEQQPPERPAG